MKPIRILATLATLAAVLTATVTSAAALSGRSAGVMTIRLRQTGVGLILTTAAGRTIYAFTRDGRNRDRCAAISGCTSVWPLVTTSGHAAAGHGVSRHLLGTIRVGGSQQITYAGRPLYTYTGDSAPGQTGYVGISQFGGAWDALNAAGRLVR
jgi:predicted lipoprotein with Yx(FWY)xxD motif